MATKNQNLELPEELGTPVPSLAQLGTDELGTRIDTISKLLGTRENAASIAGVSVDQLVGYIKGRSKPGFLPLSRLAQAAGASLDWLATGKGLMAQHIEPSTLCAGSVDVAALVRALMLVELVRVGAPLERKATAVAVAYDLLADPAQPLDVERIQRLLEPLLKTG